MMKRIKQEKKQVHLREEVDKESGWGLGGRD